MVWIALLYMTARSVAVVPNLTEADCRRVVAIHQSNGREFFGRCVQVRRP